MMEQVLLSYQPKKAIEHIVSVVEVIDHLLHSITKRVDDVVCFKINNYLDFYRSKV